MPLKSHQTNPREHENSINVFVYGTLLFPEITDRLGIVSQSSSLRRERAVLRGYRRLTVKFRGNADPPAIFVDPEGSVVGDILLDITEQSLQTLDWFEDIEHHLYTRERVSVELPNQSADTPNTMDVFVYVCGERIRNLLSGEWDPAYFRSNYLEWYLANVLPEDDKT